MASLAEEISRLTNPNPVFQDPEDGDDITGARLVGRAENDDDLEDGVTLSSTKLRRQATNLLADEDKRYAGKKISRKRLRDDSIREDHSVEDESDNSEGIEESESDESESDGEDQEKGVGDEEEDEDEDLASFKEKMKTNLPKQDKADFSFEDDGDYSKFASDSEDGEDSESEDEESGDEDSDDDDEEEEEEDEEEEDGGISAFSKSRLNEDVKKGEAVRTQLNVWDQLLKARIELQKLLVLVNRLPQHDTWNHFTNQGGEQYSTALKEAQSAMKSILDKVFVLQTELLAQHNDTKPIVDDQKSPRVEKKSVAAVEEDDEEITSDEDEAEEEESRKEKSLPMKRKRKHGLNEYPTLLSKRHKAFAQYRDDTIQKWYDKTKVASGKLNRGFSAFEQSALKQIKQVLSDQERLIKRTQLRRSTYRVLGEKENPGEEKEEEESAGPDAPMRTVGRDSTKDYNEEIFDDDDFYHQLLRELIQRKTMDINDPIALSRQWLELQKLRSKVKKKVDTRASKGRKIRYHILPKLVNFMAPVDNSSWTEEARDDLYRSLFGKRSNAGTEVPVNS